MQSIFTSYHIELSDYELKKFQTFLKFFIETNTHINLSSIRDERGIIEKHFVDSIMLVVFYDLVSTWTDTLYKVADLGTWGGFPGIPLAIVTPKAEFTLIDSVAKKITCVQNFIEKLHLKNVKTLIWRAEEIWHDVSYRENFDCVVSRATAYFPTLIEYTLPLLKVGWIFAAYKLTDKEEFTSIKKALHQLGWKIVKIKNYEINWQQRSIVFIKKITKTPIKYPRKIGIPLQKPIV